MDMDKICHPYLCCIQGHSSSPGVIVNTGHGIVLRKLGEFYFIFIFLMGVFTILHNFIA